MVIDRQNDPCQVLGNYLTFFTLEIATYGAYHQVLVLRLTEALETATYETYR